MREIQPSGTIDICERCGYVHGLWARRNIDEVDDDINIICLCGDCWNSEFEYWEKYEKDNV